MDLKAFALLGIVMTIVAMVLPYITGYLGGYTDPSMTWGIPVVSGFLTAGVFVVIYVLLLKKKSVAV